MIRCITNARSAIVFLNTDTGRFEHHRLQDIDTFGILKSTTHVGQEEDALKNILLPLLKEHPEYVEPFVDRELMEIFCECGGYAWEIVSGSLRCAECGTAYVGPEEDFPTLLVPEVLVPANPPNKGEDDNE